MPKFLVDASYTAEGLKGLLKDGGTGRRAAIEAAVKSLRRKVCFRYGCAAGDGDGSLRG